MIKINGLYIKVNTAGDVFEFRDTFDKKFNIITSYSNTKGKSTIGESILFCLGMEEILGQKNEKAVKPVLRSLIEKDGKEEIVIQSDVFLEVENSHGDVITIQRSPVHNSRQVKLVSVYENSIEEVLKKECPFKDYFVHDIGAAKNIRGFHTFLEQFIGYNLPSVTKYDGNNTKLYIQTLISCFYIEQKRGWMNILATMPTYFKIKDSKKRVLEYVLGLSVLETERAYNEAKALLKAAETEWKIVYNNIMSKNRNSEGFIIRGLSERPHIISDNEKVEILKQEFDVIKTIQEVITRINLKINQLNNISEPIIENRQEALNTELNELNELREKFSVQLSQVLTEYTLEKEELKSIKNRLSFIEKDLEENNDLKKLISLGSLENTNITKSKCPTCGQKINDTLLEQSEEIKIMNIEQSIHCLKNEKNMLEFSYAAQYKFVEDKKILVGKLEKRIEEISSRIRTIKSDLITNNKAISQNHINEIVNLEIDKNNIIEFEKNINKLYQELKIIGKKWGEAKENLAKLPSNLINDKDKKILNQFNQEFKNLLICFNFESTNIEKIYIDEYNYLPSVEGFDLYSDSSASDTIRIIWAYIIALQKISKVYGNNIGFLLLDEPAQQNTDISSAKELLKELWKLSEQQQVFVLYKMEELENLLEDLPKGSFKRIHADKHLISCVTPRE